LVKTPNNGGESSDLHVVGENTNNGGSISNIWSVRHRPRVRIKNQSTEQTSLTSHHILTANSLRLTASLYRFPFFNSLTAWSAALAVNAI
jgi:hypothetical protein